MEREDYKGVHNAYFNTRDEIIVTLPQNYLIGDHFCNVFVCPHCLEQYLDPMTAKNHAKRCQFVYSNYIAQNIAYVNADSPRKERKVCENLSRISRLASGWDFPLLHKNWRIPEFGSHVLVMTDSTRNVLSYLLFRQCHEEGWVLTDVFTPEAYRRKGFCRQLFHKATEFFKLKQHPEFMSPLSENGYSFLRAMGYPIEDSSV